MLAQHVDVVIDARRIRESGGSAVRCSMQRILIAIGAVVLLAGLLWPWLSKLGLGSLPGDIHIETANGIFFLPITTCVIISIVLSLLIWFIRR